MTKILEKRSGAAIVHFVDCSLVYRGRRDNRKRCFVDDIFLLNPFNDDVAAKFLARIKAEDGLEHRTDIVTTFDLIDLREGRGEGSEASASLESPSPLR